MTVEELEALPLHTIVHTSAGEFKQYARVYNGKRALKHCWWRNDTKEDYKTYELLKTYPDVRITK